MMTKLLNVDLKKGTTGNSIPSKTWKLSADISADVFQDLFNMLSTGHFPDNMKLSEIAAVFKDPSIRSASVLSAVSKDFWKTHAKANHRLYRIGFV